MTLTAQTYHVCCRSYDFCRCAELAAARALRRARREARQAETRMFDLPPAQPPTPKPTHTLTTMPKGGMFR